MKPSHFQAPRQMRDGQFRFNSNPIERYQSPGEHMAGVVLAVVIAIGLALALVHFWSA